MNRNNIISIDKLLIKLPALKILQMQYNLITVIGKSTFNFNNKLSTIDLSHNRIEIFIFDLARLPSLTTLYISHNLLTTLDERAFHNIIAPVVIRRKQILIYLKCNQIQCNNELKWSLNVTKIGGIKIYIDNKNCNSYHESKHIIESKIYSNMQTYVSDLCHKQG